MNFETIASKTIHKGKVFSVRLDQVRMPDGKQAQFDIIDHPPAVTLVPVDTENNIWFIRQYRHAIGGEISELPAGVIEPGEPPDLSAMGAAERLRSRIAGCPIQYSGLEIRITFSAGIAALPLDGQVAFEQLVERADRALYLAKEKRNCMAYWDDESAAPQRSL